MQSPGVRRVGRFGTLDVKGIDGDAPFGADPGESDIIALRGNSLGQTEEESDLIAGLDFHDGSIHAQFMIYLDRGRKGSVGTTVGIKRITADILVSLLHNLWIQVLVGQECLLDRLFEQRLRVGALHDSPPRLDDIKSVDRDMVRTRIDLGTENREPGDIECAGQFVEQPGAVPRDHVNHRVGTVDIVVPLNNRAQLTHRFGIRNVGEQPMNQLDVQGYFIRIGVDRVSLGQQTKMGNDLIGGDAGQLTINDFLLDHMLARQIPGVNLVAQVQTFQSPAVEGSVEGVFVTVPK